MVDPDIISEIWNEIKRLIDEHIFVLVEGKKDIRALINLGLKESQIRELKGPLFSVVESITNENIQIVCLLMDLDVEGRKLYFTLSKDLSFYGITIDNTLRELIFKTELRVIEGLGSYLEKHKI